MIALRDPLSSARPPAVARRDPRLLPIVIASAGALLFLKAVGLVSGDLDRPATRPAAAQGAQAPSLVPPAFSEVGEVDPIITGATTPRPQTQAQASPPPTSPTVTGVAPPSSATAERAILERLQDRRQELDTRARELDMRENLLRAAERRLEQRAQELRDLEGRIVALEQRRDEQEQQRFRGVVSMYETMRARDAARIFDSLDMTVLIEVARAMRPAKLADVMAQMQADPAKRLTVELARRPGQTPGTSEPRQTPVSELPKIEGRPSR